MAKTLTGPGGVKLVLDHTDAATPALVCNQSDTASSTYDCAVCEGTLAYYTSRGGGDVLLTTEQIEWLEKQMDEVEIAFNVARKDHPEYR